MRYFDEAKELWDDCVPMSGQARTKQGELLRAVEKLRDQAIRNGNMNWDDGHRHFVDYLRTSLTSDDCFTDDEKHEINDDLDRAADEEHPADDDTYDRLADRVVEWTRAHPEPIPHEPIADLSR